MAQNDLVEKSLLEKIQDLVNRKPGTCDVTFSVGKEKKIVRALKIILKASSPFLEKEFEEKWEVAVIKEGEGIPLPEFDPVAFELFVKLTSLDTWSLEILEKLILLPNQILNLLSICRHFEMGEAVENLEKLAATFMQSFGKYKDTDDFLQLSQTNLKSVLASDGIGIKELDVFHSAMRWAEFQCKEMKVEPTEERIREVLGDCLFEVRFPIMSVIEFTEASESKDILTAEESLAIYKFIGLTASKRLEFDTKKLPFKTMERKPSQILPGTSTLCLTRDVQIVENPSFVCDNSQKFHYIACEKEVTVYGLGFLGPIEKDGFYDVKVQVMEDGILHDTVMLEKRIFARKGKKFYFLFDAPIDLEAGSVSEWSKFYQILYYLKGANTFTCNRPQYSELILQEGGSKFRLTWNSNQLAEILFKLR